MPHTMLTRSRFINRSVRQGGPDIGAVLVLIGAAIAIAFPVVIAAAYPGYSHVDQFVSELGAVGSPVASWARYAGFAPAGLLLCLGLLTRLVRGPASVAEALALIGLVIYSAGYLVAAMAPCDAGCPLDATSLRQAVHNWAGLLGYLLAPPSLLLLAVAAGGRAQARVSLSFLVLALVTAGGVAALLLDLPAPGLAQRAIEAAGLAGCVLVACGQARPSRPGHPAGKG